jgi:hypothetical protein
MQKLKTYWNSNRRLVLLTFEVFWIIIFLLDRASSSSSGGVPDFVYVNF